MTRVYQAGNGQWIVLSNEIKAYFISESEARLMASKLKFADKAQDISTRLAAIIDEAADMDTVYFDRGYNSGGGDPIADADVSSLGITAADVGDFITLAQQLANFANNAAVTQGDYDATLNKMRTDV